MMNRLVCEQNQQHTLFCSSCFLNLRCACPMYIFFKYVKIYCIKRMSSNNVFPSIQIVQYYLQKACTYFFSFCIIIFEQIT